MGLVIILTNGQANTLDKNQFRADMHFNVIKDGNDEWIISQEEVDQCDNIPQFNFIKTRPLVPFVEPTIIVAPIAPPQGPPINKDKK